MLRQRGVALSVVADVLGHAFIQTTQRYDTVRDDEAWTAMDKLHVPGLAEGFSDEVNDD